MQSNRPSMTPKTMVYVSVITVAILRLLFAGFFFLAALDAKTIIISYGLIVICSFIVGLSLKKLFDILVILHKIKHIVVEDVVVSNNQKNKENE